MFRDVFPHSVKLIFAFEASLILGLSDALSSVCITPQELCGRETNVHPFPVRIRKRVPVPLSFRERYKLC